MDTTAFMTLVAACAPLVDPGTAQALVRVESSFNASAIGVVGGRLERQPLTRAEGLATAQALQTGGWNFSVGLAQINVRNFSGLGLTLERAFEPCSNLAAMQAILLDCYERATLRSSAPQPSLRRALSCYYSGNFTTGFEHGYTRRVVQAATSPAPRPPSLLHSTKEVS